MNRSIYAAILVVSAIACSKGSSDDGGKKKKKDELPELTADRIPESAKGLMVGKSTEDDVKKAFADATWSKDKSLGGDGMVAYNDHKGAYFKVESPSGPPVIDGYLADTGDGTLRLIHFELRADGVCDFVKKKIASVDGSEGCPGNRKTGDMGSEMYYCLSYKGHAVGIDCSKPRNITYSLALDGDP